MKNEKTTEGGLHKRGTAPTDTKTAADEAGKGQNAGGSDPSKADEQAQQQGSSDAAGESGEQQSDKKPEPPKADDKKSKKDDKKKDEDISSIADLLDRAAEEIDKGMGLDYAAVSIAERTKFTPEQVRTELKRRIADKQQALAAGAATQEDPLVFCNVPRAFKLRLNDQTTRNIAAGTTKLPTSWATHWYSVANGVTLVD